MNGANHGWCKRIAFTQIQPVDAPDWTPTVYAPTILCEGSGSQPGGSTLLEEIFCWNVYIFIQVGSIGNPASRITMRNVWGCPLNIGVDLIFSADINRMDNFHFWPFNTISPNISSWVQANGSAFQITRSDNFQMSNVFAYGFAYGLQILSSSDGSNLNFRMTNVEFDSTHFGYYFSVDSPGGCTGMLANCHTEDTTPGTGYGLFTTGSGTVNLDIANFQVDQAGYEAIALGVNTDLAIANLRVYVWGALAPGIPAVAVGGGSTVTLSGRFLALGGSGPATGGAGTINQSHVN